ncbi:MAG: radical SAM protein [Promethearchaeota archaeon]
MGIAGLGEALFNEETFQTLELINSKYPETQLCIYTNGLLLNKYVSHLNELRLKYITITINAISPVVGEKIYSRIIYNKKVYRRVEGAKILIENQLKGVEKSVNLGMFVKINSVLIPGINNFRL